jgi:hypothetical protein
MAKTTTGRLVEQEPFDRLEEKVKTLVALLERTRAEQTRLVEEQARTQHELDAATAKLVELEAVRADAASLREERDVIRTRVTEMLEQLDGLNL